MKKNQYNLTFSVLQGESAEADVGGAEIFVIPLCKRFKKLIPVMTFTMQMKQQYTFVPCHIVHILKMQKKSLQRGFKTATRQGNITVDM